MLSDKYFDDLGAPSPARLRKLPRWAIGYEKDLRRLARWWHAARTGRPSWQCPVPINPGDRLSKLPWWMQDWVNTLKFEVFWQQEIAQTNLFSQTVGHG